MHTRSLQQGGMRLVIETRAGDGYCTDIPRSRTGGQLSGRTLLSTGRMEVLYDVPIGTSLVLVRWLLRGKTAHPAQSTQVVAGAAVHFTSQHGILPD